MKKNSSLKHLTPEATLSQIQSADEDAVEMLASIGLDITRHKHKTLRSICQQQQWIEAEVLQWIKKHHSSVTNEYDEKSQEEINMDLTLLEWCRYMKDEYHVTGKKLMADINEGFLRLKRNAGNQYKWLKDTSWQYDQLEEKLRMHFWFKEQTFHPLVVRLYNRRNHKILHGTVHKIERALEIIETDHHQLKQLMVTIREERNNFANPADACSALRILNENLKTLFGNLRHYFWLEEKQFQPKLLKQLKQIH